MAISRDAHDFLMTRRAQLSPEEVGIPTYGRRRRVAGLRRDEVALLAGMSVDYYTRIERGYVAGVSETVLESIARALRLSEHEHAHLNDLVRIANGSTARSACPMPRQVRPSIQRLLDSITVPAWARNGRADFLAGNALGRALYAPLFIDPRRPGNTARFTFLDPRASEFYPDWSDMARGVVATLRAESARSPYDKGLTDLIGELATRSELFRQLWASHEVFTHQNGAKRINHPQVGLLELSFEALELASDPGVRILVYDAEPGSATEERLRLLGSLQALDQVVEVVERRPRPVPSDR
ncbi:MAG: helix-turn-helix transcriptional regulator [Propionibacterium sp.]|nr:helix-turn-helix transcriptional regulator [Propionibacterium sp.]